MAQDTRERILDAAKRLLLARGIAGTTTRLIAKEAGCAEGTLYVHFPDRRELFLALLEENLPAFREPIRRLASRVGRRTVRANLSDLVRASMPFYESMLPMMGALFAEPELHHAFRDILRKQGKGPHVSVVLVAKYLQEEQALGRVDAGADLLGAAHVLLGGAFFHTFLRSFAGDATDPQADERLAASLAKATWRLVAPRKARTA